MTTQSVPEAYFQPKWALPNGVKALSTYRTGGSSQPPFDSFNLGMHVGDDQSSVLNNRKHLNCPEHIAWLEQVHGNAVVEITDPNAQLLKPADAAWTTRQRQVCAIMTADCLPVLIADKKATRVAAVHCGWRSLAANILEKTIEQLAIAPEQLTVWLGPCIGPLKFEVGAEVKARFVQLDAQNSHAFKPSNAIGSEVDADGKYLADLYWLAKRKLLQMGISDISQDNRCTVTQPELFYSYRRDGQTGRMASLIWLD